MPPPAIAEPRVTVSPMRVSCSTSPSIRADPCSRTSAPSPLCVVLARIVSLLRAAAKEFDGGVKQRIVVGESTEAGTRWSPKRQRAVVSAGAGTPAGAPSPGCSGWMSGLSGGSACCAGSGPGRKPVPCTSKLEPPPSPPEIGVVLSRTG